MHREAREELRIRWIMAILEYARLFGNATETCREFEIPRSSFYKWKKAYEKRGRGDLVKKKKVVRKMKI